MTNLDKPVSRRTQGKHPRWDRRVVATLHPGDVIKLRLERGTREFSLPLNTVYDIAEMQTTKALTRSE